MRASRRRRFLGMVMAVPLFLASGCAMHSNRESWGAGARLLPELGNIREAAVGAATEARTWVPLAGALLLQAGDLDAKVSD